MSLDLQSVEDTPVLDQEAIEAKHRAALSGHVAHIAHMLSEQGPMSVTFVHNNTLLGLQSMHFEQAIAKAESFNGGRGFLDNDAYREYHKVGRITDGDIRDALSKRTELTLDTVLAKVGKKKLVSGDVHYLNMVHGFDAVSPGRLADLTQQEGGLSALPETVDSDARAAAVAGATADAAALDGVFGPVAFAEWLNGALALGIATEDEAAAQQAITDHLDALFGIEGTAAALSAYIKSNAEHWTARSQWGAVLGQLGLTDPTLDDTGEGAESLSEEQRTLARRGGPAVPVTAEDREAISAIIKAEIETLEVADSRGPAEVALARLLWAVQHGLGADEIDRQGYDALLHLLTERGGAEEADGHLAESLRRSDPRAQVIKHTEDILTMDLGAMDGGENHADFIERVTGESITKEVNDYMIGVCSSFLDEGLAAWHMPSRATGFYEAWRNLVRSDRTFDFDGVQDWRSSVDELPLRSLDAVVSQLQHMGISPEGWGDYCGRALAHLKGWAGMIFWRQVNPTYGRQQAQPIDLMQYLAVRLFYQNLLVSKTCANTWNLHPETDSLRAYFSNNLAEYFVRRELFAGRLGDSLAQQARALVTATSSSVDLSVRWQALADLIWAERSSGGIARAASDQGWRMLRLCQHVGLTAEEIRGLSVEERDALIDTMDSFSGKDHGPAWLLAFEKNYRDEICNALALNRGRGRWLSRKENRPKSQVVFCIDEREESIHRHYEELDPGHETMGAAGFFGVAMDYRGLDEHDTTPLCPAPVTPGHRILEVVRDEDAGAPMEKHETRAKWAEVYHDTYWEMKRNPVASYFLIDVTGFLTAIPLIGRMFFPLKYFSAMAKVGKAFVPEVKTRLAITRDDADENLVDDRAMGFTVAEQADRVEGLLRNIGLLEDFAPIVVICAHGSSSENNPYLNAYDCGACGGKGGEPNARAVAVMANNPDVRKVLAERSIVIPDDTWFVGGFHNTATEVVTLTDEIDIPEAIRPNYEAVKRDMAEAVRRAARERCRRFASAPKDSTLEASLEHTMERAADFSQIRPELGHATNACAVVGRRALTQGMFFDRRSFIISYDPTTDPEGTVLERILLAVGPVGAGINLEYYFSTVDPGVYGSDSKIPHNVTGMIGVMEGAHSDLRTGLPRQMTEVHEPMRLHLIVDADPNIAGAIYGRQPGIQQLLDGEWVILIVHDPATGDLLRFVPGVGFEKWDDSNLQEVPEVAESFDWFKGKYQCFIPPARITEPTKSWLE
ncbi:MAG: putative inorganic carbon transporter subunit DabA [Pseudomonadota bacterium]